MATTISLPTAHNGGPAMNAILLENGVNSGNPALSASVVQHHLVDPFLNQILSLIQVGGRVVSYGV